MPSPCCICCRYRLHCHHGLIHPVAAIYVTPLLCARSMLSPNGKNASDPSATPVSLSSHALFSSLVNTSGFSVKIFSQVPSASTSIYSSPIYRSIALSRSARLIPSLNGRCKYFRALSQPPVICLLSCKTGTVDTGLLSGSDSDCLSVFYIAYRI